MPTQKQKALSANDRQSMIYDAWRQFEERVDGDGHFYYVWIVDSYDDYVIARNRSTYYRVAYAIDGGTVTFAPRDEWQRVEKEWIEAKGISTEPVTFAGGAIKAMGDGRLGGYAVRFTSEADPDLTGDWFTEKTFFGHNDGDGITPIFHHGFGLGDGGVQMSDAEFKAVNELADRVLSNPAKTKRDEIGLFAEVVMNMHDEYESMLYELGAKGMLAYSTGAVSQGVRRKDNVKSGEITRWILGELSLTPTPAEPRNFVAALKSLMPDDAPEAEDPQATTPEVAKNATAMDAGQSASVPSDKDPAAGKAAQNTQSTPEANTPVITEVKTMTEEKKAVEEQPQDGAFDAMKAMMDKQGEQIEQIMKYMEDSPAIRKSGYFSVDGGDADQNTKSFGDFLKAIHRKDVKRLASVYGSTKDLTGDVGSEGGFLVPDEYNTSLLSMAKAKSYIMDNVTTVPVTSAAGTFPSLDQFLTPTAGSGETAKAAGVKATGRKQAAALTETEPSFKDLNYSVKNIGGFTQVSNELIADSPFAIEVLLKNLYAIAVASKVERDIVRGIGTGSDLLGIMNASCAIGVDPVTDNTFAYADMLNMQAKYLPANGKPVWLISQTMLPDIGQWEIGSNGAGVPQSVGTPEQLTTMPGTLDPMIKSEHMPVADASGCVILADLAAYLLFEREGLRIAFSEHVGFTDNKGTWRFTYRADGMPWLNNYITLANPGTAQTVSPFVYFND